ncbi:division/cell wall cluster transcriptional repressor MraZ [Plastorhodobacter daqingensis]|uniref:Transcriptional regulator MraZ n=1 Tax=Plastorhodobacter daqingensis TaxID=1387281 RepID=A0ABW2UF24_9RHOB
MAQTFRGEFNQKVDTKGRVSIPAPFRRVLEAGDPDWAEGQRPRFVIVYGDERRKFLECYTISAMREVEAQIARLPRGTPRRRLLERVMITLSHTCEVDEDGRIVLPQKLRDKIALSAEAVFAGALDTFQIWQPAAYEADLVQEAQAELEALPEGADILSLLGDLPGA